MSNPDGRIFSSWKEIAAYLGKGVRTVQRWEKTLELPVRRPNGPASNVVVATESDLRRWLNEGGSSNVRERQTNVRELQEKVAKLELAHARLQRSLDEIETRFQFVQNALQAKTALEDSIVKGLDGRGQRTVPTLRSKLSTEDGKDES